MKHFAEVLDALEEPLVLLDSAEEPVFFNAALLRLIGSSEDEISDLKTFWRDRSVLRKAPGEYTSEFFSRSGNRMVVRLRVERLPGGFVLVRVRGSQADGISLGGYQGQRLETLGMLAGGIAHDFNNILAGILGHITYLKTILPAAGDHIESLQAIEDGARKASSMTQQILDFSRLDSEQKPQHVDLVQLASSTCRLLKGALSPDYRIEVDAPRHPVRVLAIEARLAQVIANLVINARDACEADSAIRLRISAVEADAEVQNLFQAAEVAVNEYALLEVIDEGLGIPEDIIDRVFEPYFTTKENKGTGLGLATVKAIVGMFGGAIQLESEVGKGTRVAIYLPLLESADEQAETPSGRTGLPLERGSERILVIDDERPVRNVLTMSLEHLGYEVDTAASGLEAIEKFKRTGNGFDLVILDMLMPKLPGDEVFDVLRELDPDVRVLVISGFSSEDAVKKILRNGGLGFIQKPFTIDELSRKVRECFRSAVKLTPTIAEERK